MIGVILAHPVKESFNYAVYDAVLNGIKASGRNYSVMDLYAEGFNPVLSAEELTGQYTNGDDPALIRYQKILKESSELVMIFPVWWYDTPAIMKGFFDRVLQLNFAYTETSMGITPLLGNIKKAVAVTTSTSPRWYLKFLAGNPVKGVILDATLKSVGVKERVWLHTSALKPTASDAVKREKYLEKVRQYFAQGG